MLPQQFNNDSLGYLLEQAVHIAEEKPAYQEQWLLSVGGYLVDLYKLEDFTVMAQNKALYTVNKAWEGLSRDATHKWQYDFLTWAKAFTKRRGVDPADETIENKITVYRDWVAEPIIKFPEFVAIDERDGAGRETGNIIKIEFDPEKCDYSKLLQARRAAKEGVLSDEAWSILLDPYKTVKQLQRAMGQTQDRDPSDLKFYQQEGIIIAEKLGHRVEVLAPIFDNIADPLFKEAVAHAYGVLGITIPAELR